MSTELPGYDAWKLASPPEAAPCYCGHEAGDHGTHEPEERGGREFGQLVCWVNGCKCEEYDEYSYDDWADDMRERRAEMRSGY